MTLTWPAACAGVFAVSLMELTKTTLVAAPPPTVTVAPLTKPVPLMMMGEPPVTRPAPGTTLVTVTGETLTVMLADLASEQPAAVVTVTFNVVVPTAPAVKVMLVVPLPAVMEPLVMPHTYVAPTPALATEAPALLPLGMEAGAVMVAFGNGLTVTWVAADGALVQPLVVTVTV